MRIFIEDFPDYTIIKLKGRLNVLSSDELYDRVVEKYNQGTYHYILDLSELEYISSSGIRILYILLNKLGEHDGQLVIGAPNKDLLQIFELINLSFHFTIADTIEEAIVKIK